MLDNIESFLFKSLIIYIHNKINTLRVNENKNLIYVKNNVLIKYFLIYNILIYIKYNF